MNITDAQADAVESIGKALANQGFRVATDLRNEKIGYKIREHTLQRVPYLLVIGDREKENGRRSRTRSGKIWGRCHRKILPRGCVPNRSRSSEMAGGHTIQPMRMPT